MGLGADAPNAPSYQPMLDASLQAFHSDQDAASMFYGLAPGQLQYGNDLTAASGERSQAYLKMAQDAQNWGRQQFNDIWPYAKDYLSSQSSLSKLAGENADESIIAAREARQRATDTYNRYRDVFMPAEDKFVQSALDYNSPARADQASASAQADVRTAADAARQRQEQELRGRGLDPSDPAYAGANRIADIATSAAQAGAGTQARERSYLTGLDLTGKAASMGANLPTQALQELQQATSGASTGIQTGQAGSGGITGATGAMTAGVNAGGSPIGYSYVAGNPYTTSAGQQLGSANSLYGQGTSALGNLAPVIAGATGAQKAGADEQLASFAATQKSENDAWSGLFKAAGGIGSFLTSPATGTIGASMLGFLSDRRLKEDIKPIGRVGGLPMYTFRYKGSPALQVGYMADEVERVDPRAVFTTPSGYKAVDYTRATLSALGG